MNWKSLSKIAEEAGDSFFIFDSERFVRNAFEFRKAFTGRYAKSEVAYSLKTNYLPRALQLLRLSEFKVEVVSGLELDIALNIGFSGGSIIFNGPVKSRASLEKAMKVGALINLDSRDEFNEITNLSMMKGLNVRIAIRCNLDLDDGSLSRFGISPQSPDFVHILRMAEMLPTVELEGLHCHLPGRSLKSFSRRIEFLLNVTKQHFKDPIKVINVGGGYQSCTIPIDANIAQHNFNEYATVICESMSMAYPLGSNQPKLILEPGSALVADTMTYWSKIKTVKQIGDRNFATIDGTILDVSPNSKSERQISMHVSHESSLRENSKREWYVVGHTCIEGDVITSNYVGDIKVGDFLGFTHVGSYNLVMRPPFIREHAPIIELQGSDNELVFLRKSPSSDEFLSSYNLIT